MKNCFRKHCKTFNKFLQRNDGGRSCNITSHHTTTCNTNIILCCACNIFCVGNSEFSLLQAVIFFFCSLIISYRIISQIPSLVYLFMGLRVDPTCVRIHFFQVCMLLLQRRAKIELGMYAFISQPPPYQHQKLWTDSMSKISLEHFTFYAYSMYAEYTICKMRILCIIYIICMYTPTITTLFPFSFRT